MLTGVHTHTPPSFAAAAAATSESSAWLLCHHHHHHGMAHTIALAVLIPKKASAHTHTSTKHDKSSQIKHTHTMRDDGVVMLKSINTINALINNNNNNTNNDTHTKRCWS